MNDVKKIFKVVEEKTPIAKTNDNILIPNYSGVKSIAQKNYTWTFTDNVYLAYQKGLYSTYSTGANVQIFEVDNGDSNTAVSGVSNVNKFGMNLNGVQLGNSTGGFSCSNVSTYSAQIRVNSACRMFFDSNGNVGIGTTAPTHSLTMGSTGTGIALYNTADQTTNFERGLLSWTSNVLELRNGSGGTGTARTLRLRVNSAGGDAGSSAVDFIMKRWSAPAVQFNIPESSTLLSSSGSAVNINVGTSVSSGVPSILSLTGSINTSGTAGYTALLINPTETATGSGIKNLINAQVGGTDKFTVSNTGVTTLSNVLRLKSYTVATLPTGTVGDLAYVTDAVAPTYLGALTGGGTVKVPVFYNGTAWVSH